MGLKELLVPGVTFFSVGLIDAVGEDGAVEAGSDVVYVSVGGCRLSVPHADPHDTASRTRTTSFARFPANAP